MSNRFLFMADAHIKARTWTNSLQLTDDSYTALNTIIETLPKLSDGSGRREPISTLVIGGDWFDSNRPSSTDILRTNYFLDQFSCVYYIAGNHDNVNPSFLSAFDCNRTVNVRLLTEIPVKLDEQENVWIAGIDWMSSSDRLQELITDICSDWKAAHTAEEVLYLVLHTSFQHLLHVDGAYKLTQEFIERVTEGTSIRVLVGDVHVRNTSYIEHSDGHNRYIHSPGSLYPLSIDQIDHQHAVSVIDAVSGEITDVPVKVRSYSVLKYTTDERLMELYTRIVTSSEHLPLCPFIRVLVGADEDVHIDVTQFPDAVVQVLRESADMQEQRLDTTHGCTLIQAAVEEAGDDALLSQLVEAILVADDPLQELKTWLDFWKVTQTV